MRTTIDLSDDVHRQARAIARDTHRTLSETVSDLIRRGLTEGNAARPTLSPKSRLPVVSIGTVMRAEDVRSLKDED
jgi:hypothetical protein